MTKSKSKSTTSRPLKATRGNFPVVAIGASAGGLAGIILGTWIFAVMYPKLKNGIMKRGNFGDITFPQLLKVNDWIVVVPAALLIIIMLVWFESAGL